MKKRIEHIIREIRKQSFSQNTAFSDEVMTLFLNEAQNEIRKIIFLANNQSNLLKGSYTISLVSGQKKYDLPDRIFADNSILTVKAQSGDEPLYQINPVSMKNYGLLFGYTLYNKQIWLSTISDSFDVDNLVVFYNAELPTLAIRSGKVSSIDGNELTLSSFDVDLAYKSDFITTCDQYGDQIATDIQIESFNPSTGILVVDDASLISQNDYILAGEYSVNTPSLPYNCYDYLKKYVERRMAKEDGAQSGFNTADLFSETEKNAIIQIFQSSSDDTYLPEFGSDTIII